MVRSASFTMLRAADAALCKSGTTTLEAAVAGCPLVVAYRTSRLNVRRRRRLVKISNIGLVNVVAGHDASRRSSCRTRFSPRPWPTRSNRCSIAAARERRVMIEGLTRVRASLGQPGAAAAWPIWR